MARTKSKCFERRRRVHCCSDVTAFALRVMSVRSSAIVMFVLVCDGRRLTIWRASVDSSTNENQRKYKDVSVCFLLLCVCLPPSTSGRYGVEDAEFPELSKVVFCSF